MTVPGAKPKLGLPGSPGVVVVGHDIHGGHGYKGGVIDDYPIRFGLVKHDKPESSKPPVNTPIRRRRYYGEQNAGKI